MRGVSRNMALLIAVTTTPSLTRLERIASARLAVVGNLQTTVKQALHVVIRLERERRRRSG